LGIVKIVMSCTIRVIKLLSNQNYILIIHFWGNLTRRAMNLLLSLLLIGFTSFPLSGNTTSLMTDKASTVTAFVNVNVVPMDADHILEGMTVIVIGDRITAIGNADAVQVPDGATTINAAGKYLMPGLAEMHGHVPPTQSGSLPARYVEDVLFLYLAGGITTVRGMLGYPGQLQLKEKVNNGEMLGPNLYLAGPSFNGNSISSPEEASAKVRQHAEEGWDLLKVHPGLTLDEYTAMAQTANELGIAFAGHIPEDVGLENAIRLGQLTIDHLDGYMTYASGMNAPANAEKLREAVKLSKEYEIWVVPTQALWETLIGASNHDTLKAYDEIRYMPKAVINGWNNYLNNLANSYLNSGRFAEVHANNRNQLLKELQDAGVRILMGTDAPQVYSVPGFSIHRELASMQRAGLTPYEIILSGTYNVGAYFSDKDDFGTISVGSRADMILLAENPLNDIAAIKESEGVMIRGQWLSRSFIDQKLAEIEAAYRE